MRKIIAFDTIKDGNNFWIWFFAALFPQSWDADTDQTISEAIMDNYEFDEKWANAFTGYYDGIFDESDGYIENPKTLQIELSDGKMLSIEVHPGDIYYFIEDKEIGCIGPHYKIKTISWQDFAIYTKSWTYQQKLLLMPMLGIKDGEQITLEELIVNGSREVKAIRWEDYEKIRQGIVSHCIIDG